MHSRLLLNELHFQIDYRWHSSQQPAAATLDCGKDDRVTDAFTAGEKLTPDLETAGMLFAYQG